MLPQFCCASPQTLEHGADDDQETALLSYDPKVVPAGFQPVLVWQFLPPKGILLDMVSFFTNPVNHAYHVFVFVKHGDILFASAVGTFLAFTVIMQFVFISCLDNMAGLTILGAFILSGKRGLYTMGIGKSMAISRLMLAPATGLVTPYGMSLQADLSLLTFLSVGGGLVTSALSIAQAVIEEELGAGIKDSTQVTSRSGFGGIHEGGKVVAKQQYPTLWTVVGLHRKVGVLAELALFAVASYVLHPVFPLAFYLISAVTNAAGQRSGEGMLCNIMVEILNVPGLWFPAKASPFGALRNPNFVLKPSFAIALRLIALPVLAVALDFPSGIADYYTLDRPMGGEVLRNGFVSPAVAVSHAAGSCITSMVSGSLAKCVLPANEMSPGSQLLHALLLALVCLLVPLHLAGTLGLLVCSPSFFKATADEGLIEKAEDKQHQIEVWAEARSKFLEAAGLCEVWRSGRELQFAEEAKY